MVNEHTGDLQHQVGSLDGRRASDLGQSDMPAEHHSQMCADAGQPGEQDSNGTAL